MLRRYTWEKAKNECRHYRRRKPDTTELYKIIYNAHERLPIVWEDRFQGTYGVYRDEVKKALLEYLNCGVLDHGAARVYCDTCKLSLFVAFSCKKRGVCPSCSTKRAVNFAEHLHDDVLEKVPHRHTVFSIPKRLRSYFKYDRNLGTILFKAAWQSIEECLGKAGFSTALVLTLQTAGDALNWNPHLHGMLVDGLFSKDGTFQRFNEIDQKAITYRFGEIVLSELSKRELITDDVTSQILSQEFTGFSVWFGDPFDDSESERFVARYVERGPLSLEKLSVADDIVTYTTKDGSAHEFDALEFLAILTSHIPNTYESITRYYGWYSCRKRGERSKLSPDASGDILEPTHKPSSSWARCIKQVYELDPLECPKCKGNMRIISFITDPADISKIMKAQGIPQFRAPPSIPLTNFDDYDNYNRIDPLPDYEL